MSKSLIPAIILFLFCFHSWNEARAAPGPLDSIDSRFIFENFPLETMVGIDPQSTESDKIPGCIQTKSFQVSDANVPGQIVVALCNEGEFGPSDIESTLAKRVAGAKEALAHMPAQLAQAMLAGVDPITVSLADGKQGKALTIPYVGHGFVLVPFAYAVTASGNASIVVQAYLNPNTPRDLNKPIAVLLQAIHQRIQ